MLLTSAKVAMEKRQAKQGFALLRCLMSRSKDAIENLNDISLGKKPLVVKQAEREVGVVVAVVLREAIVVVHPWYRGGAPGGGFNNRPGNRITQRSQSH